MFPDDNECSSINLEKMDVTNIPRPKLMRSVAGTFSPKDFHVIQNDKDLFDELFLSNKPNNNIRLLNEAFIKSTFNKTK